MTDSQCAIFHFDVKTMSARDAEGREPSRASDGPLVFESLADAERYSKDKIASTLGLGCRIYDRDGKILGTFVDPQTVFPTKALATAYRIHMKDRRLVELAIPSNLPRDGDLGSCTWTLR